mmetsp:Transcript_32059/g.74587  ORF Transcript_32059/g.74587 Transcript_32059/m.74587 type:complete len:381 (-) Transcript_32059:782-1924(-)
MMMMVMMMGSNGPASGKVLAVVLGEALREGVPALVVLAALPERRMTLVAGVLEEASRREAHSLLLGARLAHHPHLPAAEAPHGRYPLNLVRINLVSLNQSAGPALLGVIILVVKVHVVQRVLVFCAVVTITLEHRKVLLRDLSVDNPLKAPGSVRGRADLRHVYTLVLLLLTVSHHVTNHPFHPARQTLSVMLNDRTHKLLCVHCAHIPMLLPVSVHGVYPAVVVQIPPLEPGEERLRPPHVLVVDCRVGHKLQKVVVQVDKGRDAQARLSERATLRGPIHTDGYAALKGVAKHVSDHLIHSADLLVLVHLLMHLKPCLETVSHTVPIHLLRPAYRSPHIVRCVRVMVLVARNPANARVVAHPLFVVFPKRHRLVPMEVV